MHASYDLGRGGMPLHVAVLQAFKPPCLHLLASQFLADVRELERATKWTRAVDSKYHSLFGVRCGIPF